MRLLRTLWQAVAIHRPTRFERAYIALYNGRIMLADFAEAAGIPDKRQAWRQLCEYRTQVVKGVIMDPWDKYNKWR